jgi:hypothetical protein
MSFRFLKQSKVAPEYATNLSKGWPSLSTGGHAATLGVSRRGPRAAFGIPPGDLNWQFGGPRHVHKAIQAQAEVKAVHAQGTAKAVEAQAYLIAITHRMETVAKRLTKKSPGSAYWKKAAIEQAQLLDEMLEVAKASENDLLISAVRKCQDAWGNDDPHTRAALNAGMTVTECLANRLAGIKPDQNGTADCSKLPATIANNSDPLAVAEPSVNRKKLVLRQEKIELSIDGPAFWLAFGKTLARNLILPAIGCSLVAGVYTISARKPIARPQIVVVATPVPATPIPEAVPVALATPIPAATFAAETPVAPPAPTEATEAIATPFQREQLTHDKAVREKHSNHNSTHRPER